jgi:hypothetical protein
MFRQISPELLRFPFNRLAISGGLGKGGEGGGGTRDRELIFSVMKLQLLLKIVTFTAVN